MKLKIVLDNDTTEVISLNADDPLYSGECKAFETTMRTYGAKSFRIHPVAN